MSERPRPAQNNDKALEEAAEWFARLQNAQATDEDRRAFRAWLARDRKNHDAFTATKRIWHDLDRPAQLAGQDGWHRHGLYRPTLPQRILQSGAALALTAIILGSAAIWRDAGLIDRAFAEYATAQGEQREIILADGSTAYLDGDSALDTDFTGNDRSVALLRGRVWFDIVRDEARPFRVKSNEVEVHVLGTAFAVEENAGTIVVSVERGLVSVSSPGSDEQLTVGEAVSIDEGGTPHRFNVETETELAWRRGLIVMNHTPLVHVIDQLERMSSGRVIVRDESLGDLRLSGVFKADEPETILAALRSTLGLRTLRVPGLATVIYR